MAETPTSVKRFTRKVVIQKCFPPKRSIGMSNKEPHLKFVPTAVALRKIFQHNEHSYASTENSESAVLLCPSCNFQTSGSLEDHHKHHEQNYGFQCPFCSYSVNEGEELDFHLRNHHNNKPMVSKDEDPVSPLEKKKRLSKRLLRCDQCLFGSFREEVLEKHRQLHVTKSIYQCTRCSYSVCFSQHLSYHMTNHHPEVESDTLSGEGGISLDKRAKLTHYENEEVEPDDSLLKCDECNFFTNKMDKMKFHQSCHTSEYKRKCPHCSFSYFLKNVLKHHVKHHHQNDAANIPPESEDAPNPPTPIETNLICQEHHIHVNQAVFPSLEKSEEEITMELDTTPIEPRNLVEEEKSLVGEEILTVCPLTEPAEQADELVPDAPPIEPGNVNDEKKSCHGNEIIPPLLVPEEVTGSISTPDDLVPNLPSPVEINKLVQKNDDGNDAAIESQAPTENLEPDSAPMESRNLVEKEEKRSNGEKIKDAYPLPDPKAAASITPADDLVPDAPQAIEPVNVDEEDRICLEQLYHHENEATCPLSHPKENAGSFSATDDLAIDPTPIEPRDLDNEEKSCHEDDSTFPSPEPEDAVGSISKTDVMLVLDPTPIEPRNLDEEERNCREQLAQLEEALQTDGRSLENSCKQLMELEEKTQSQRKRLETAKKDEQVKEKMLKDLLLTKKEVDEQKKETKIKKMKLEFELRTEQCKSLELDLIEPDAVGEDHQERVASFQKKIKSLEEEVREIGKELAQLVEQEEAINGDLVDTKDFYMVAARSLSAKKTELEEIETSWKVVANSHNLLVDSLKEKIHAYHELLENLLEIELEKKKENIIKEKANLLLHLKIQYDDSNIEDS